ncbi:MAG: hypothetical protein QW290_04485 [Sulfolobales archaeon]
MAERRVVLVRVDDVDEERGVVYLALYEGGERIAVVPVGLDELRREKKGKELVERVVREFIRGFRRAENVRAKDLSAYAELEGEMVVE